MPRARGPTVHAKHHRPDVIATTQEALDVSPAEARSARMSSVYRDQQNPVKVDNRNTVGPARSLREHILSMSLFPSLYNRSTVVSSD